MRPGAAIVRNRLALAAIALAAAGCSDTAGSTEPGAPELELEPFEPPAAYRMLWSEIQSCSALRGNFSLIEFYRVTSHLRFNGERFLCGANGEVCYGAWEPPHRILLAPGLVDHPRIVKHEMLHELLRAADHPPLFEACDVDV